MKSVTADLIFFFCLFYIRFSEIELQPLSTVSGQFAPSDLLLTVPTFRTSCDDPRSALTKTLETPPRLGWACVSESLVEFNVNN